MNRRGLLALLGGAVAAPSVGVKAAAEALGVSNVVGLGSGSLENVACAPSSGGWWNSPPQIALDAKERATQDMHHGRAYPHMKSWGHGFRSSVVERDHLLLMTYRQKMQEDASFREKIFAALGVKP
jgi:hypothetical protein